MSKSELFTLEAALAQDREAIVKNHKEYLNTALVSLQGLIGFTRHFVRAEGFRVWDSDGVEYLDFLGGYGSLNHGHNHPKVCAAVQKAFGLPNLLQASLGAMPAALAHNLAQITPGNLKHCFFCNSGAEAVEGALKLVRIATGKPRVIYCQGAFHGKTFGSLSVTGRKKYQEPFQPLLNNFTPVPYNDLAALQQELAGGGVAAVILEPIQGEGGIIVPDDGYLTGVRQLCDQYDSYLIVDEIQTGFGRTGYLFACEYEQVTPDVLCLAKSLGGGVMPIGAYITTESIWNKAYGSLERCLLHTSTFGGNAVACAAGIAAIETIFEEDLVKSAREKGDYLLTKLRELAAKYPLIQAVRGRGLLVGVEFKQPVQGGIWEKLGGSLVNRLSEEYIAAMVAGELLNKYHIITAYTLNNPNVIRFEPPLGIGYAEIDKLIAALTEILEQNKSFWSLAKATGKSALGNLFKK